jgi:hypothetical protein
VCATRPVRKVCRTQAPPPQSFSACVAASSPTNDPRLHRDQTPRRRPARNLRSTRGVLQLIGTWPVVRPYSAW